MTLPRMTRRGALHTAAAALALPSVYRVGRAAPSETLLHVSVEQNELWCEMDIYYAGRWEEQNRDVRLIATRKEK